MRRVVGRWVALFFFSNRINATARARLVLAYPSVVSSETELLCVIQKEREIKRSPGADLLVIGCGGK
jgi:hypothetical protein